MKKQMLIASASMLVLVAAMTAQSAQAAKPLIQMALDSLDHENTGIILEEQKSLDVIFFEGGAAEKNYNPYRGPLMIDQAPLGFVTPNQKHVVFEPFGLEVSELAQAGSNPDTIINLIRLALPADPRGLEVQAELKLRSDEYHQVRGFSVESAGPPEEVPGLADRRKAMLEDIAILTGETARKSSEEQMAIEGKNPVWITGGFMPPGLVVADDKKLGTGSSGMDEEEYPDDSVDSRVVLKKEPSPGFLFAQGGIVPLAHEAAEMGTGIGERVSDDVPALFRETADGETGHVVASEVAAVLDQEAQRDQRELSAEAEDNIILARELKTMDAGEYEATPFYSANAHLLADLVSGEEQLIEGVALNAKSLVADENALFHSATTGPDTFPGLLEEDSALKATGPRSKPSEPVLVVLPTFDGPR